ncbi:putative transcription factor TGA6 [Iris pallida]|uniref:Transcription factor TGA6 n=1 Tax=Iris pallida TaxID=29817 RepID=A0AAX6E0Y8_IRIPA|nr:putative transcription factor TGA6 [Iris pallida]
MQHPLRLRTDHHVIFRAPGPSSDQEIFSEFFNCWLSEIERDLRLLYAMAAASPRRARQPVHRRPAGPGPRRPDRRPPRVLHPSQVGVGPRGRAADVQPDVDQLDRKPVLLGGRVQAVVGVPRALLQVGAAAGLAAGEGDDAAARPRLEAEGDLGDLSHSQLVRIDSLMRETIRHEREISEQEASAQESVGSTSMGPYRTKSRRRYWSRRRRAAG